MKASAQTLSVSGPSSNRKNPENLGIPTLHSNYKMQTTDHDKANTLNNHFKSVFTNEQLPISSKGPSQFPSIQTLDIGVNGVRKQLEALKPHKATGPDEFPARVLKETASEISTIFQHIFQQSYTTANSHKLGPQLLSHQYTKKATKVILPTTGQFP